MTCNVGGADRMERIFHGVAFLLIAAFLVGGGWRWVLGTYGLLRLATGVFAFCPAYVPIRHSTWKHGSRIRDAVPRVVSRPALDERLRRE